MEKNEKKSGTPSSLNSKHEESPDNNKRRDAIKKTLAAGGVTLVATKWTEPVVESIVLPAHAQTSTVSLIARIVF